MNVQNSFAVTCRKIATIKQSMIEGKVIYVPPFGIKQPTNLQVLLFFLDSCQQLDTELWPTVVDD